MNARVSTSASTTRVPTYSPASSMKWSRLRTPNTCRQVRRSTHRTPEQFPSLKRRGKERTPPPLFYWTPYWYPQYHVQLRHSQQSRQGSATRPEGARKVFLDPAGRLLCGPQAGRQSLARDQCSRFIRFTAPYRTSANSRQQAGRYGLPRRLPFELFRSGGSPAG